MSEIESTVNPVHAGRVVTLRISRTEVHLISSGGTFSDRVGGLTIEAHELLAELEDLRKERAIMPAFIEDLGRALGDSFLDGPPGAALDREVAAADVSGVPLVLAIDVADADLVDLPWDTLVLPASVRMSSESRPLGLSPNVLLHRTVGHGPAPVGQPPSHSLPLPLRVVVAIASPEHGRGSLLNYERELAKLLEELGPALTSGAVEVRILNWGTASAIRTALAVRPAHVLHVSCHGAPGYLCLETDTGDDDLVSAERFVDEILPTNHPVPLIILSACSTGREPASDVGQAPQGLARNLISRGAPAVLAMTESISDRYAVAFAQQFYTELAGDPVTDPLSVFCRVRRVLAERHALDPETLGMAAEWVIPAMFLRGEPAALSSHPGRTGAHEMDRHDRNMPAEAGPAMSFVGRRAELRDLIRVLSSDRPWVSLCGLAGIGKTALVVETVRMLSGDAGSVVTLSGFLTPEAILDRLEQQLGVCSASTDAWLTRLSWLGDHVLRPRKVLLVLDGIDEDLVQDGPALHHLNDQLARFLRGWLDLGACAALLTTSRCAYSLHDGPHDRMQRRHLGPLSRAEVAKLFVELPALGAAVREGFVTREKLNQIGGHPAALQHIEASLRDGNHRSDAVVDTALRAAAANAGLTRVFDDLTADDAVCRLVGWASAFRRPVTRTGLNWLLVTSSMPVRDADRDARLTAALEMQRCLSADEASPLTSPSDQLREDLADATRPKDDPDLSGVLDRAMGIGLIVGPFNPAAATTDDRYTVVPIVAAFIQEIDDLIPPADAHRRAAAYWRWVYATELQEPGYSIAEAECMDDIYYHTQLSDGAAAAAKIVPELALALLSLATPLTVFKALALCHDAIGRNPGPSRDLCGLHLQTMLGHTMMGSSDEAIGAALRACAVANELGDQVMIAVSSLTAARLLLAQGNADAISPLREEGMKAADRAANPVLKAMGVQLDATVAVVRGDLQEVVRLNEQALALVDGATRAWVAGSVRQGQLDMIKNALDPATVSSHAEHDAHIVGLSALDVEIQSKLQLASNACLQNRFGDAGRLARDVLALAHECILPIFLPAAWHLTGLVAQSRGNVDEAETAFRRGRQAALHVRDAHALAACLTCLGEVSLQRGSDRLASRWFRQAFDTAQRAGLDHLAGMISFRLAVLSLVDGKPDGAKWLDRTNTLIGHSDNPLLAAFNAYCQAVDHNMRQDHAEADRLIRLAMERASSVGFTQAESSFVSLLTINAVESRDSDAAAAAAELLKDVADESGHPITQGGALLLYGHLLTEEASTVAELDEAEDMLRRALEILEQIPAHGMIASCVDRLATISAKRGKPDDNQSKYLKETGRIVGDENAIIQAIGYEFLTALHEERTTEARAHLEELRTRTAGTSRELSVGIFAGQLAAVEGNIDQAREDWTMTYQRARAAGQLETAVSAASSLADLAHELGDLATAEGHLATALVLNAGLDDHPETVRLLDELAAVSLARSASQPEHHWWTPLYAVTIESTDPLLITACCRELGSRARVLGDDHNAERWLRQALATPPASADNAHIKLEQDLARCALISILGKDHNRWIEMVELMAQDIEADSALGASHYLTLPLLRGVIGDEEFEAALRRSVRSDICQAILSSTKGTG